MKVILFIIMYGFCSNAISEDSLETRESFVSEYKLKYCEDTRFLLCTDIEKETCIAAIDNANNACESKYPSIENYTESSLELFIFKLCAMGELPLQEGFNNKGSEFCLDLPAIKKNENN